MNREEHLQQCKKNALEYVERGSVKNGWLSFVSDLNKHPQTRNHPAIKLGMMMEVSGNLDSQDEMKKFIEGFS